MNKHLLLGTALLAALSAYPQDAQKVKPSGFTLRGPKSYPTEGTGQQNFTAPKNPVKVKQTNNNSAKTMVISSARFSSSANAFGVLVTESNSLCYNKDINTVSFVHRASPNYTAAPTNGNTGTIISKYSVNNGASWDSTVMWTNNTNLARYPQGGIYNPIGNTNISNARVVAMGPYTIGAGGWPGQWYASKALSIPGSLTPGSDMQSKANAAATASCNVHHWSRMAFSATDDGKVRSVAQIENDPAATSYSAIAYRGAGIVTGVFSAGAFVWTMDSLIPPVLTNTVSSYKYMDINAIQAWNDAGTHGYVVFYGCRAGENHPTDPNRVNPKGGWQPIVYKTTNSGASWVLLPANDFTTAQYTALTDRLYPTSASTNVIVPYFNTSESRDAVVDINNNLHLVTTVIQHYSDHKDSLGYTFQFNSTEKYQWSHQGSFNHPTIYDFSTNSSGGWDMLMVDSMATEGPSGGTASTNPGYNVNPWVDATTANNKLYLEARIQASRTADGRRLFYSWTETDTSLSGHYWNIYPDIVMKGRDLTLNMMTPRMGNLNVTNGYTSITDGLPVISAAAYFHYMGDKVMGSGTGSSNTIPFSVTTNSVTDGGVPVNHYYLSGVDVPLTAYSIPTGIKSAPVKTIADYDVNNYPNPATDFTTINVNLKDATAFDITVYNSVGQLIQTMKIDGTKGDNQVNLNLSNLSKGVYFYNVKANGSVVSKKLIVQ